MKKQILLIIMVLSITFTAYGQLEDFESYTDGGTVTSNCNPLEDKWFPYDCENCNGCLLSVSSAEAYDGNLSGYVPAGSINSVYFLGNQVFNRWSLTFYMYVRSGKEASWNLQGEVPVGEGISIVGNVLFNENNSMPGVGVIEDTVLGEITFDFPHDEWFKLDLVVDMSTGASNATWSFCVDNSSVIPVGTPFFDLSSGTASSLGGVNFFANSPDTEYYVDDIDFLTTSLDSCEILGLNDSLVENIMFYPNPTNDILYVESGHLLINKLILYDVFGKKIKEQETDVEQLNLSNLPSGVLFLEVYTKEGVVVKKIVKE